jgi:hypothetical protein
MRSLPSVEPLFAARTALQKPSRKSRSRQREIGEDRNTRAWEWIRCVRLPGKVWVGRPTTDDVSEPNYLIVNLTHASHSRFFPLFTSSHPTQSSLGLLHPLLTVTSIPVNFNHPANLPSNQPPTQLKTSRAFSLVPHYSATVHTPPISSQPLITYADVESVCRRYSYQFLAL